MKPQLSRNHLPTLIKLGVFLILFLAALTYTHPADAFITSGDCTVNNGGCGTGATCSDLGGGSVSCGCNTGYSDEGMECTDIDECSFDTDNCDSHATCTNTPGSFTCACNSGYSGDGVTCTLDVDECALGTDNCSNHATCANTTGSFTCTCNSGYSGDGVTCTNVDECTLGTDNCGDLATCIDTEGSYTCSCASGTRLHENACYPDLCLPSSGGCRSNQTCTFVDDVFVCVFTTSTGGGTTSTPTTTRTPACTLTPYKGIHESSDRQHFLIACLSVFSLIGTVLGIKNYLFKR